MRSFLRSSSGVVLEIDGHLFQSSACSCFCSYTVFLFIHNVFEVLIVIKSSTLFLKEYQVEELFDQVKQLSSEPFPSVSEDKKEQALRTANAKLRYQILHLRKVTRHECARRQAEDTGADTGI